MLSSVLSLRGDGAFHFRYYFKPVLDPINRKRKEKIRMASVKYIFLFVLFEAVFLTLDFVFRFCSECLFLCSPING